MHTHTECIPQSFPTVSPTQTTFLLLIQPLSLAFLNYYFHFTFSVPIQKMQISSVAFFLSFFSSFCFSPSCPLPPLARPIQSRFLYLCFPAHFPPPSPMICFSHLPTPEPSLSSFVSPLLCLLCMYTLVCVCVCLTLRDRKRC